MLVLYYALVQMVLYQHTAAFHNTQTAPQTTAQTTTQTTTLTTTLTTASTESGYLFAVKLIVSKQKF